MNKLEDNLGNNSKENLEINLLESTKNILEKNLNILEKKFFDAKKILIYDKNSFLSKKIFSAYLKNFLEIENKNKNFLEKVLIKIGIKKSNFEFFDFDKSDKNFLKEKLLNLPENSTVVLIQSTNFRLDNFRIRLNLHNRGISCLEHNHLGYIKSDQYGTYANSIKYRSEYYNEAGEWIKEKGEKMDEIIIECKDGSVLRGTGGIEKMKKNTGIYNFEKSAFERKIGGTLPVGEIFSEIKDFDKLNGELSIYCFPGEDFQIITTKPFKVKVEKSCVKKIEGENYPDEFLKLLDKIEKSEDGEVSLRELGFGLNPGITKTNQLSDVAAYERIEGFHVSLGKKHNIYRSKFDKKISQRYHIDIFPDVKNIFFKTGNKMEKIFEADENSEKYLFPDREKFGE